MTHRVTLIPGDGIGPEVCAAARRALEATGVPFEWDVQEMGAESYAREGPPLLERTIASVRERGLALKGPTSTPAGKGFRSINIALRKELDLYAGIRPCKHYPGVRTPFPGTRRGRDPHEPGGPVRGHRVPPRRGGRRRAAAAGARDARRRAVAGGRHLAEAAVRDPRRPAVARRAFEYARANGRRKVTAVHKATVMRYTDGVFLEACREVAAGYPDVEFDDRLVDNVCHQLVSHPEDCDVLLAPIMYGDILSDVAAGLVGGLGMAPGANVGDDAAVFEAVHGSAPKHAGHDRANPFALMLSGAMLLRHVDEDDAADRLEAAIAAVIEEGTVTYDLKPDSGTIRRSGTPSARFDRTARHSRNCFSP